MLYYEKFCFSQGPEQLASDHVKHLYVETRLITAHKEWPPDQPQHFTSLALIHYKNGYTHREVTDISEKICDCTVDDVMNMFPTSSHNILSKQSQDQVKTSKDVKEIFAPGKDDQEPRSILIEGSPGIGKTVLSKQIAFQWAKGLLLMNKILLFLVFLRDPLVQKIASLKDLVKYYYQFDESSENVASSCAEYLLHSDGKHVTFVFDGYDEYPEMLQQKSFISGILQRRILPCCQLVVTSRPHASTYLRANCNRFIEILGFTKEDQRNYMISSLKGEQDADELIEYLDFHPTISSLCFVPFNLTVLLWLYKKNVTLPSGSTKLYNCFICHTIRHHLAKYEIHLPDNFDLNNLEEPYRQVIVQLSILSYKALNEKKSTFTLDEVTSACPQINKIPPALMINGFGLLQAARCFGLKMNTTLNFVHFTVQEFLAAYYISCLPHYQQFCVIQEKFMSDSYANTFAMYAGMTKGENPAFIQYLGGGNNKLIAYMYGIFAMCRVYRFTSFRIYEPCFDTYPGSPFKISFWLRLFKCFNEADDNMSCCKIIYSISFLFSGNVIVSETLLPSDVECLGLFLCRGQKWKGLYFHHSFNNAHFRIFHQSLTNEANPPCIHTIYFGSNLNSQLTTQYSSHLITEIARSCRTKVLEVFGPLLLLEDVVSLKSQLTKLIFYTKRTQTAIPICLNDDKILKVLDCYENLSNKDPTEAFMEALELNNVKECSSAYLIWMKLCCKVKLAMLNGNVYLKRAKLTTLLGIVYCLFLLVICLNDAHIYPFHDEFHNWCNSGTITM